MVFALIGIIGFDGQTELAALMSSTRFVKLDAMAWTNNTMRVVARNIPGAASDLAALTVAVR